jgi:hypothetical protein
VVSESDNFVHPGSEMVILAEGSMVDGSVSRLRDELRNFTLKVEQGVTTERRALEAIQPQSFDHVVVLCYSDDLDAQQADARTLVTLLHLRDIADRTGARFTIVSEMLDERNRQLAEVTRVDDVIVSDRITSLMLAQISENPDLTKVFSELFSAEGSELYLRPAGEYLRIGTEVNFATVVEAALRRNESAIGYRRLADTDDPESGYGVIINPPKSERFVTAEGDKVIVLAES